MPRNIQVVSLSIKVKERDDTKTSYFMTNLQGQINGKVVKTRFHIFRLTFIIQIQVLTDSAY